MDIESQIGHKLYLRAVADATDYVGSYKIAHHWTEEWFLRHPPYLIFVIFFTLAKFLENKIYTEKTRKLRQNTP